MRKSLFKHIFKRNPNPDTNRISQPHLPVEEKISRPAETSIEPEPSSASRSSQLAQYHYESEILDNIDDSFYSVDQDWKFTYMNRNAELVFHEKREDLVGRRLWDEFPGMVGSPLYDIQMDAMRTRQPVHHEAFSPITGGWVSIDVYPMPDGGMTVHFQDIDERKQAEQALKESKDRLQFAIEAAGASAWTYDVDRDRILVVAQNPNWTHKLPDFDGLTDQEASAYFQPEEYNQFRDVLLKAVQTGLPFMTENRLIGNQGQLIWIQSSGRLVTDPTNQSRTIFGVSQDIDEKKRLENEQIRLLNEVRSQKERFATALKHSSVSIFHLDRNLRYIWVFNPPDDLDPDAMIGKKEEEIFPEDDIRELAALRQKAIEQKTNLRREIAFVRRDTIEYSDITVEPTFDPSGEVTGTIISLVNTTPLRQLEQEVIDSAARIKVQQTLIDQREQERVQIARELHDGPLQELIAATYAVQTLAIDLQDPMVANALSQINQIMQDQVHTIREFTTLLRPPIFSRIGFEDAIRSHVNSFQEKNPDLAVELALEPIDELTSLSSRLALFRICQETLTNVMKHAHATQVIVTLRRNQNSVEMKIQDNGIGFQLPNDWVDLAQNGHLGLVGIRERAEAVGGRPEFYSQPGKGTLVIISVPIAHTDAF
jgi:PAS domain S-box-containing protein